jgi:hypothetical protein
MNWLDNVSSDSDQPIAAACLMQGHWRHRLHPYAEPSLCRIVIDAATARLVAAQIVDDGRVDDLGGSALEDLQQGLVDAGVFHQPSAWGFQLCAMLPTWAKPSFSEQQIEELERIEGYLIEATDDNIESVLKLRDQFLRGIGLTDQHVVRAVRASRQAPASRKGSQAIN